MTPKTLHPKLKAITSKIGDRDLRKKVTDMLQNPTFEVDGETYAGLPLDISPAGLSHHHSYPGGLIEHVVSTATIAMAMCDSVEEVYHGKVNRDIVLACVLLHDVFKPTTYRLDENGTCSSASLADRLDHLSIATSEVVRRGFPLELIHAVSAHHGEYGPNRPRTVEALICHLADFADSRLNGEVLDAAAYLTRKARGMEIRGLNSKEAFEIVHSKTTEGWTGVTKTVDRISRERKIRKD